MGSFILRGITTALLVTVLTLFAGIIWGAMGLGGLSISQLVDIGLLISCLVGGYRTAKESGVWFMGGVTGAGYVTVGTLLLALFLPIQGWGFVKVLAEGALIGLVAGAFGAGSKGKVGGNWTSSNDRSYFTPSYVGYGTNDRVSSEFDWDTEVVAKGDSQGKKAAKKNPDEASEIEWPWDRENNKKRSKSSQIGDWEVSETWKSELLEDEVPSKDRWRQDKTSAAKGAMEKVSPGISQDPRPWWEQ